MSFAQLSNTLISGLDLLVCNLSLGAAMMGLMSIAKTIPGSIAVLINTIANVFAPKYTILYARGDIAGLVREVGLTSRLQSFLLMVPIAGFIVFGEDFYRLWQPGKTPEELRIISVISILSCVMYLFTCHTQALTMLNSVCNRMRLPVLVTFGIGLFSIAVVLVCLQLFALDEAMAAYLIAGVSSCLMSVRALVFIPVYAAHLLKQRWTIFYPMLLRSLMTFAVLTLLFMLMRSLFVIRTWLMLATACFIAAAAGYALSLLLLFGPKEIRRFLHRKQV
jgi:O-antigen/teichoic acid export membrane protein